MPQLQTRRRPIGDNPSEEQIRKFFHESRIIGWLESAGGGHRLSLTSEYYILRRRRGKVLFAGVVSLDQWQDIGVYAFLSGAMEDLQRRAEACPHMDLRRWFYAEMVTAGKQDAPTTEKEQTDDQTTH